MVKVFPKYQRKNDTRNLVLVYNEEAFKACGGWSVRVHGVDYIYTALMVYAEGILDYNWPGWTQSVLNCEMRDLTFRKRLYKNSPK